jgi:hypothetical protein
MTRIDDTVVRVCVDSVEDDVYDHAQLEIHEGLMRLTNDHVVDPILVHVWSKMHRLTHMHFKDVT